METNDFIDLQSDDWTTNGYAHFNMNEFAKKSSKPCYVSENEDASSYKEMMELTIEAMKTNEFKEWVLESYEVEKEKWKELLHSSIGIFYKTVVNIDYKSYAHSILENFMEDGFGERWESFDTYISNISY